MANNYKPNWRIWTKIVALINLNLTVLHLLTLSWLLVVWIIYPEIIRLIPHEINIPEYIVLALRTFVACEAVKIIFGLWAVYELIKATELGREPEEAHDSCLKWHIFNTLGLMITLSYVSWLYGILKRIFSTDYFGYLAYPCVFLVFEIISMFIVAMFRGELRKLSCDSMFM